MQRDDRTTRSILDPTSSLLYLTVPNRRCLLYLSFTFFRSTDRHPLALHARLCAPLRMPGHISMAVEDCDSVDLQRNPGGMGYPLRLKRVTARIPAQTVRGTRAEEPQAAYGVEVRVREWRRQVIVSKVSHLRHETPLL